MSSSPLGYGSPLHRRDADQRTEHILVQRPLKRILAFTGRSIDDVVNNAIAKREVLGYYKLDCQIQRHMDVRDLERQWNPLGRSA